VAEAAWPTFTISTTISTWIDRGCEIVGMELCGTIVGAGTRIRRG